MTDMHRETYREVARGPFSVRQLSGQDHKPVGFDEMAYAINEERSRMLTAGVS